MTEPTPSPAAILNAPPRYESTAFPGLEPATPSLIGLFDWIQIFVQNKREVVRPLDLKWITLISVNETWSAFSLRPYKPGEARQSFR